MNGATGAQLSQSFITLRYTPRKRISFDVSDNYFRGVPTFDQRLIGTGLLDQYLFTGISGGVRVEPIDNLMLTANFGNSRRNGDTSHAVNQAYGVTWKRLPILGSPLRSSLQLLQQQLWDGFLRIGRAHAGVIGSPAPAVSGGRAEHAVDLFVNHTRARFFNSMIDWQIGRHYFVMGNWLNYRGLSQNYDQISISLGYRFGK